MKIYLSIENEIVTYELFVEANVIIWAMSISTSVQWLFDEYIIPHFCLCNICGELRIKIVKGYVLVELI